MEFKRNNRRAPFRYNFVMVGTGFTFEFESFMPTEPSPTAFEIPIACRTTSSGVILQQVLSYLLVAICIVYVSVYI